MDRGAWWATVHGAAKSWTWLKHFHFHADSDRERRRAFFWCSREGAEVKSRAHTHPWPRHSGQPLTSVLWLVLVTGLPLLGDRKVTRLKLTERMPMRGGAVLHNRPETRSDPGESGSCSRYLQKRRTLTPHSEIVTNNIFRCILPVLKSIRWKQSSPMLSPVFYVSLRLALGVSWWGHFLVSLVPSCSVIKSCPTLCNPMGCSLPGSSVHGILQVRVLEWVSVSFKKGSSWSNPHLLHWQVDSLPLSHQGSPRRSPIIWACRKWANEGKSLGLLATIEPHTSSGQEPLYPVCHHFTQHLIGTFKQWMDLSGSCQMPAAVGSTMSTAPQKFMTHKYSHSSSKDRTYALWSLRQCSVTPTPGSSPPETHGGISLASSPFPTVGIPTILVGKIIWVIFLL